MKIILEFGNKGGTHTDNQKVNSAKEASRIAVSLVTVFTNDAKATSLEDWKFDKCGRLTWENDTHFVAISKMDGKLRGSASSTLWRKSYDPKPGIVVRHA